MKNNMSAPSAYPYLDPIAVPQVYGTLPKHVITDKEVKDSNKKEFMDKVSEMYDIIKNIECMNLSNNNCTHVFCNGQIALSDPNENGKRKCNICGKEFKLIDIDSETTLDDILESAKVYGDPKVIDTIKEIINDSKK